MKVYCDNGHCTKNVKGQCTADEVSLTNNGHKVFILDCLTYEKTSVKRCQKETCQSTNIKEIATDIYRCNDCGFTSRLY